MLCEAAPQPRGWWWCEEDVPLGASTGLGRGLGLGRNVLLLHWFCEASCAGSSCCEPMGWGGSALRCVDSCVPGELQVGQGVWWWLLCWVPFKNEQMKWRDALSLRHKVEAVVLKLDRDEGAKVV